jgi:hypothetical protein
MIRIKSISIATILPVLLCLIVLAQGCKKDEDNDTITPSLAFEKTDYSELEIAQLNPININLDQASYQATIDGITTVDLIVQDGALVFAMPGLSAANHTLTVSLAGAEYVVSFNITALPTITNPTGYINNFIAAYNTRKTDLMQRADSLPTADKTLLLNDLQAIQGFIDQANQQLIGANDTQKLFAARVLQANKVWMDELNTAVDELVLAAGAFKMTGVINHDARTTAAMENYVKCKLAVIEHIPKVAIFIGSGFVIGSIFPGAGNAIGAAIGAGYGLGDMLRSLADLNLAIEDLVDIALLPFQNMVASDKMQLPFPVGQYRDLTVNIDYRTAYSGDKTSQVPLMRTFIGGLAVLKVKWNWLVSKLPISLQFGPKNIDSITTYNTQTIQIHSDYLTISDISDPSINVVIDKSDGYFKVKFSSSNTLPLGSGINFTFKVNYRNSNLVNLSYPVEGRLFNNPCWDFYFTVESGIDVGGCCQITLLPQGGTPPYTFLWWSSDPCDSNAVNTNSSFLSAGGCGGFLDMGCTITDANGCQKQFF